MTIIAHFGEKKMFGSYTIHNIIGSLMHYSGSSISSSLMRGRHVCMVICNLQVGRWPGACIHKLMAACVPSYIVCSVLDIIFLNVANDAFCLATSSNLNLHNVTPWLKLVYTDCVLYLSLQCY